MPPKKLGKKPWTDLHQKKLIWLYNWYTNNYDSQANIETFIDKNKRKLMSLILNNKDWSIASKEALLFMIARYLYNIKNNDRYVKLYAQSAYDLLQEKNKLEGLNELDQKEIENHRSIEFLNNSLEVHKEKEKENILEHFKHLLLMMLIKQPPLRTSFYSSAKFFTVIN